MLQVQVTVASIPNEEIGSLLQDAIHLDVFIELQLCCRFMVHFSCIEAKASIHPKMALGDVKYVNIHWNTYCFTQRYPIISLECWSGGAGEMQKASWMGKMRMAG